MKFIVLLFKNKVRQKSVRNGTRRPPGSILRESVVVLGGLVVILDLLGASVLEVDFREDFEGYPGGAQIEMHVLDIPPAGRNRLSHSNLLFRIALGLRRIHA